MAPRVLLAALLVSALFAAAASGGAQAGTVRACPPASLLPVVDLERARPYSDRIGSPSLPSVAARHAAETAPLKQWLSNIAKSADRYRAKGGEPGTVAARCALTPQVVLAELAALKGDDWFSADDARYTGLP